MKAIRVHAFGGVDAMSYEDVERRDPGPGQVLIRVAAAGVGPWDAWVREGRSVLPQPLPLTLGADLSGVVEAVGPAVTLFQPGDEVFGVTNGRFTDAYAEYAVAQAGMTAPKPTTLTHIEAASVPVVACTAQQMLFDHGHVQAGQTVLVLGGAGNVGAYAVQLAHYAGARVIATCRPGDVDRVRSLGANEVVPTDAPQAGLAGSVDVVIDTVGGAAQTQAFDWVRRGGALVSAVSAPDLDRAERQGVSARFILVSVTTAALRRLTALFDAGTLRTHVGEVLPLSDARIAHRMLEGQKHRPGKIVLVP